MGQHGLSRRDFLRASAIGATSIDALVHLFSAPSSESAELTDGARIYEFLRNEQVWVKHDKNPILRPGKPGEWDDDTVTGPTVLKEGDNRVMYYKGKNRNDDTGIGMAVYNPTNGQWEKYSGNPLIIPGPKGSWYSKDLGAPKVLKVENILMMYVRGDSKGKGRKTRSVGLFESYDNGNKWEDKGVVLEPSHGKWDGGGIWDFHVLFARGEFKMWYRGSPEDEERGGAIGYSSSKTGKKLFDKHERPVLEPGGFNSWDEVRLAGLSVMDFGVGYGMWFGGSDRQYHQNLGYAYGENETKLVKFGNNPVLRRGTQGSWDDNRIDNPFVMIEGDKLLLFYRGNTGTKHGSGHSIGLATLQLR